MCAVSYPVVERAARRSATPMQLVSLEPEQLDDVFEHIRLVGRLTERDAAAERVVDGLQDRIRRVRERVGQLPARPVVILEWIDPPFNAGHWTPGLVQMAGGRDLLGTAGRPAHPIEWKAVIGSRPVRLLMRSSLSRTSPDSDAVTNRLPTSFAISGLCGSRPRVSTFFFVAQLCVPGMRKTWSRLCV